MTDIKSDSDIAAVENKKTCTKCGISKDKDRGFYKFKRREKIRIYSHCRDCQNRRRQDLRERTQERKQFSIVEKMLTADKLFNFNKELLKGERPLKNVAEEYGVPFGNVYYYYNNKIASRA